MWPLWPRTNKQPEQHQMKDIFTYKDKGPHGVWRPIDYVAIQRRHLYTLCQTSVLWGAQKPFPSADHYLVSILMLCADPLVRKARKGSRNARPQRVIKGSQQQLADAVSTLSLTGLGWADGSKAIYDTAKAVVGTERRKARYWVYDNVGEVDRIITVRMKKAAGNTKEACDKARRDFAALKDAWWNDCASRLQRAAENGDTKVVHQLHREVCGPTQRKAITLPMPGGGTSKTAKETAEAFEMHFGKVLNQDGNVDPNFILSRLPQRSVHEALDNSISREVDEAVRLLKNSKVPGDDGLPNEIWKIGALTDYLVEVCNHALEGEAPKEWVDCTITPIYKKGSPNDPDNYRGIALLSTGSKVFQCGPDMEVAESPGP